MNVVDSSGWLEYFADGENASFFAPAIEDTENLIVPVICIYEVFKRLMTQRGENIALVSIGDMHRGKIADTTAPIALQAAKLSTELKIAMADSIILATARAYEATLWTQDGDFEGIDGVEYIKKG
ncbi:MAG: VapC toxin family PIN domain ribonuclease [Anaerolinea sp. 4484_236]|nr:MAG: VapC toxin family PIN domain ribonuclease [Anaerolinea sp. 4484_236]OQY37573.1 MAG: VapC toxin family PIN domain ribonuclease [Anaerolineaceae bacterium 4572_5.2]RLD08545.1 MAG: VapC toxin family PIN domain ribonuclease [Chloroflexota bacterium]